MAESRPYDVDQLDPNNRFGKTVSSDEKLDPDSYEHNEAMKKTGFWGNRGAGCIMMASDTKRFLIAHRGLKVEQPSEWGTWGGAIDAGLNPREAVRNEVNQEANFKSSERLERRISHMRLIPLLVFKATKHGEEVFRYYNYLAVLKSEFTPRLDKENQGYKWCAFGDWPSPLHFGFQAILDDPKSIATIQKAMLDDASRDSRRGIAIA